MRLKSYWICTLVSLLVGATAVIVAHKRPNIQARSVSQQGASASIDRRSSKAPRTLAALSFPRSRFDDWVHRYDTAALTAKSALETEGLQLAQLRHAEEEELIRTRPQVAIETAFDPKVRQSLPPAISSLIEVPISGRGDFLLLGTLPTAGAPADPATGVSRRVMIAGQSFAAFVYGRRTTEHTHAQIPLHGVALGGLMAVAESPLRVLAPGEQPDPTQQQLPEICEISGKPADPQATSANGQDSPVAVEVGNEIHFLCSANHVQLLEKKLIAQESGFSDAPPPTLRQAVSQPTVNLAYTTGPKQVLFIRVRFANQPAGSEPEDDATSQSTLAGANLFLGENSYGKTSIAGTLTPVYVLPHDESWYNDPANDSSGFALQVLTDGRAVAANPSSYPGNETLSAFNYLDYDFEVVRYNGGPGNFSGQAFIGARGLWLKSNSPGALAHELGHNYGLGHANRWSPISDDLNGVGSNFEYGDVFDTMGLAQGGRYAFNAGHRNQLGWLPDENVQTVTSSGTYRIYTFDQPILTPGAFYMLRVHKDLERDYWGEFRQQWPDNRWTQNGLQLRWNPWSQSNGGSQLIDTQPGNNSDGANDSAVVLGRTFSDRVAGIHLTPIAKGGTSPESLDVVVNLGSYPNDQAPIATLAVSATQAGVNQTVTFAVTASDPNGDPLAYDWEFDNSTVGPNAPVATASWSQEGNYRATVTVSDMKGKSFIASALITVGAPATLTISGHVTESQGRPAPGVRVYDNLAGPAYHGAITDNDGNYVLTNIPPGIYPIAAASDFYPTILPAGFNNPVAAGANTINFVATLPPPTVSVEATVANTLEGSPLPGVFTFSRQNDTPISDPLTIAFTMSGSAATDGSDYVLSSPAPLSYDPTSQIGHVTIPAGSTSTTVQLQPIDDNLAEGSEAAILALNADATYKLSNNEQTATINIADNDAPDYLTEFFNSTAKPFDLNGHTLTFTPSSSSTYRGNLGGATVFPSVASGGTVLAQNGQIFVPLAAGNADDGYWRIDLPDTRALFFGGTYSTLYLNTNGSITFNEGDLNPVGSVTAHFALERPRIAAYWRDLDLSHSGTVSYRTLTTPGLERTVVTFQEVPFYGDPTHHADFQVELWSSGVITFTWLDSSAADPAVGLSPGLGAAFTFYESDLSLYPPLPPSFNTWRAAHFTPAELEDPSLSGPLADFDRDGVSNLLEYALGRDPKATDAQPAFASNFIAVDGQTYLAVSFERSTTATDVTLTPQFGSDLRTWSADTVQVGATLPSNHGTEQVTYRDTVPANSVSVRFSRLNVTRP